MGANLDLVKEMMRALQARGLIFPLGCMRTFCAKPMQAMAAVWGGAGTGLTCQWRGQKAHGATREPLTVVREMEATLQRSDVDVSDYFHEDFVWDANYGCGLKHGLQEFESGWYCPFRAAFGGRDFRTVHFMQDGDWATCFGACHARLDADLMGMWRRGSRLRSLILISGVSKARKLLKISCALILQASSRSWAVICSVAGCGGRPGICPTLRTRP